MASLPYLQFYAADYLANTTHLTTQEHGAYLLLIFNYWQKGESFKAKDERTLNKRLASVARMSEQEWEDVKETLSEFFEISENEWKHARLERDLFCANEKSNKAKDAGKASAQKRAALQVADKKDESNERSTDVEQTFNHKIRKEKIRKEKIREEKAISTADAVQKNPPSDEQEIFAEEKNHAPAVEENPTAPPNKPKSTHEQQLALLAEYGVTDPQVCADFLAGRKAKRTSPLSVSAMNGIQREAYKAGISVADAVRISAERGWAGFGHDWDGVKGKNPKTRTQEAMVYRPTVAAQILAGTGVFAELEASYPIAIDGVCEVLQ